MEMEVGAADTSVDVIVEGENVERKGKQILCGGVGIGRKKGRGRNPEIYWKKHCTLSHQQHCEESIIIIMIPLLRIIYEGA